VSVEPVAGSEVAVPRSPAPLSAAHLAVLGPEEKVRFLLETFLGTRKSDQTQRVYRRNLERWLYYCASLNLDPLGDEVLTVHVETWQKAMRTVYDGDKPPAEATIAQRVAAVSSWYRWLCRDNFVPRNPAEAAERPSVDQDDSATLGLTQHQAGALLDAAASDTDRRSQPTRNVAIVTLLLDNALRIGELIALDLASMGTARGYRTLRVVGKGKKEVTVPLAPQTVRVLDAWLAVRGEAPGPLFCTRTGKRMTQSAMWTLVRRLAGLAHQQRPELQMANAAERLSPHGLRHTAITAALDAGVTLRDAQDYARHADPRTTRRYDRTRHSFDRHATFAVTAFLAAGRRQHDDDPTDLEEGSDHAAG
jgi:site-specific recombinase XerD